MKYLSLIVILLAAQAATAQDWAQATLQKARADSWVRLKALLEQQ